jgi:hypothetical protein
MEKIQEAVREDVLTEAQREFLNANLEEDTARPGRGIRIVFGSDNARPMIDDLREAGILIPWDIMKSRPSSEPPINLLGHKIPVVMTLVGSYRLTPLGEAALSKL